MSEKVTNLIEEVKSLLSWSSPSWLRLWRREFGVSPLLPLLLPWPLPLPLLPLLKRRPSSTLC